jgi:pyruvate dehydrogenase E1 component alpha subunit
LIEQGAAPAVDAETVLALYRTSLTIRLFEQRVAREFRTGEIPGFVHTYIGEEAVAAGVCANLDDSDYVTSTHRGHGHCIAKGCDLDRMMAEIYGRQDGLCRGRGGSMHIADFSRGMLGANAIVGGGIALATGAGLAASVRGSRQVAVAFFGDGAANQGVLHESLNLASIWSLPVVYVCENNGFAESTPAAYATSVPDVAARAAAYGIPGVIVDGADAVAVFTAAREAVRRARAGHGPTLLEVKTYRFRGHFEGDPDRYRDDDEREQVRREDALQHLRERLLSTGYATAEELDDLAAEIEASVGRAVEFARASPFPDPAEIERYVYPEDPAATGASRAR